MVGKTDWQQVAVYLGIAYFILRIVWDAIVYFMKKKDGISTADHEAIHQINLSLVEIRETQKKLGTDQESFKNKLKYLDRRSDGTEEDVRNLQEAIRSIGRDHNANHIQHINFDEILKRKINVS
jgi:hypothetical protein